MTLQSGLMRNITLWRKQNISYLAIPLSQQLITCAGQEELNHDCSQNSAASDPSPRSTVDVFWCFVNIHSSKCLGINQKNNEFYVCHKISYALRITFVILTIFINKSVTDLYDGWKHDSNHMYMNDRLLQKFHFYSLFFS